MEETTAILISQYRWSPPKKCFQELCGCDFLGLVGSAGEGEHGHRPVGAQLRLGTGRAAGMGPGLAPGDGREHAGCWEHPQQVSHEPHGSWAGTGVIPTGGSPLSPAQGDLVSSVGRESWARHSHCQHWIFCSGLNHTELGISFLVKTCFPSWDLAFRKGNSELPRNALAF